MLAFIKLCEDKYQKEKNLDGSWTTETLCFDVLRQSEKYFKLARANTAAERLGADVSEIFYLLAQGRARENISSRRERIPRNYKEDFVGKEMNSREKRKGCARDADLCQITLSVELALGWGKGRVGWILNETTSD